MLWMSIKNFNRLATVTWVQEFYNEWILDNTNTITQNTYIWLPLQYPEDPTNPYSPSDWMIIVRDPIPETVQWATQTYTLKYYYSTSPILYTLPWIYHNPTLWLISYSSNWSTWYTIADKNLWASSVQWNWYMYQRWNNHWWTSTPANKSSTKQDPTWYWPWNYYDNDLFITWSYRWTWWGSTWNANLWWNTTGTSAARQWPCQSWFHIWTSSEFNTIANIVIWLVWSNQADDCKQYFLMPSSYKTISYDWYVSSYDKNNLWWCSDWNCTERWWKYVHIYTTPSWIGTEWPCYWYQIRPMKNTPVQPDTDWTILYKSWN